MFHSLVFKNVSVLISETWSRFVAAPKVSLQTNDMWCGVDTWLQTESKRLLSISQTTMINNIRPLVYTCKPTIAYYFDVRLVDNS